MWPHNPGCNNTFQEKGFDMQANLDHPERLISTYKLLNVLSIDSELNALSSIVSPGNRKERSILCLTHPHTVRYLQAQLESPRMKPLENHHNQKRRRLKDFQSTAKNKDPQQKDLNLQVSGPPIY
jgi:hypothetical protein